MSTDTPDQEIFSEVRPALHDATLDLLGATIQVTDDDWAAPSALPGWSRAELAAHIARHADAFRGIVEGALRGEDVPLYPTPEAREEGIRAGAGRSGLAIQEDLDSACGRLEHAFDEVTDWAMPVLLRDSRVPVAALVRGRLSEVVIHHIDLAIGARFDDLDPRIAAVVLDWAVDRIGHKPGAPALRLVTPDGRTWLTPAASAPDISEAAVTTVTGTPQRLLGWLSGRAGADTVSGAQGVVVPSW